MTAQTGRMQAYPPMAPRPTGPAAPDTLLGAVLAGAGLIGLGCTFLPLVSLTIDTDAMVDVFGSELSSSDITILRDTSASIDFSFYGMFSGSLLIAAAIPLALILALFAGGALLAGHSAKNLVAASGVASIFTLLLLTITAIRPMNTLTSSVEDLVVDVDEDLPAVWSYGAGLYVTAAMVAVAAGIAIWSCLRKA